MNSMESIGVCSLDACSTTHSEGSLSPSNDLNAIVDNNYTSSAYTLKSTSLILSNGSASPIPKLANPELRVEEYDVTDKAVVQDSEKEERSPNETPICLKGKEASQCLDPGHLPSYLGISCAISGYSGYSRYCHSRDNSPARITSTVSISKFPSVSSKSSHNFELNHSEQDVEYLSNSKPRSKTESYICNKYFGVGSLSDGKSESNPNFVSSHNITLTKNVNGADSYVKEMELKEAKPCHYITRKSKSSEETGISNGLGFGHHQLTDHCKWKDMSVNDFEDNFRKQNDVREPKLRDLPSLPSPNEGPKSLVQQRIESLFGQPASNVVQGGAIRASRPKARTPVDINTAKRSPSCPPQTFRASSRSPPVFRHITQDFKEQLRNATVPTKNIPVKPMLSPNKQLASLPISKDSKREKGACSDAKASSPKQMLRAASEPKAAFPKALTCVTIEDQNLITAKAPAPASNEACDGHFFIKKIDAATEDIRKRIKEVEEDSKLPGIPEEALGKLLSAAGKANLLIEQKFAQFRSLCEKNIAPEASEPRPTSNDLAGFWDMVLLQVDNVNETFSTLRQLKARQWKEESVPYTRSISQSKAQPKRTTRASKSNPTTPERSAKASELAKAREEQRKKLMEAKKRGRQQKPCDDDIAIFAPDQATN